MDNKFDMKYLLFICLLTSCSSNFIFSSKPEPTPCSASLELKINGYFLNCDYVDVIEIYRDKYGYIGRAVCVKRNK